MPWTLDADQINLVSNGVVFRASIGRELYSFSLAGSREMLHSLGRCAAQLSLSGANPFSGARSIPASSNPFAGN